MNDSESEAPTPAQPVGLQMLAIVAAALALGLAYDSSSPLGVRAGRQPASSAPAPGLDHSAHASPVQVLPPPPPTGHVNQTISIAFEPAAGPAPSVDGPSARPAANHAHDMEFPTLTWAEVKPLLAAGKIVLVDARLATNYEISHVPGAISFPANSPSVDVQLFATKYPKNTPFVIYCGSAQCHMSHQLAEVFYKVCGYTNVTEMPGGFSEYLAAESVAGGLAR